jgi:hypothetical protein
MIARACELRCAACGSGDVFRAFKQKGESERLYYQNWPYQWPRDFEDEYFVRKYDEFIYKKDCLRHKCRCCGYEWHTATEAETFRERLLAHMNEKEEERRIKYRPLNRIDNND